MESNYFILNQTWPTSCCILKLGKVKIFTSDKILHNSKYVKFFKITHLPTLFSYPLTFPSVNVISDFSPGFLLEIGPWNWVGAHKIWAFLGPLSPTRSAVPFKSKVQPTKISIFPLPTETIPSQQKRRREGKKLIFCSATSHFTTTRRIEQPLIGARSFCRLSLSETIAAGSAAQEVLFERVEVRGSREFQCVDSKNGMELGSKSPAAQSQSPQTRSSRGKGSPRLFIREMVMRNFKSYAGEQRVGPFHKVRVCPSLPALCSSMIYSLSCPELQDSWALFLFEEISYEIRPWDSILIVDISPCISGERQKPPES